MVISCNNSISLLKKLFFVLYMTTLSRQNIVSWIIFLIIAILNWEDFFGANFKAFSMSGLGTLG